jgi:hypothetical protein
VINETNEPSILSFSIFTILPLVRLFDLVGSKRRNRTTNTWKVQYTGDYPVLLSLVKNNPDLWNVTLRRVAGDPWKNRKPCLSLLGLQKGNGRDDRDSPDDLGK